MFWGKCGVGRRERMRDGDWLFGWGWEMRVVEKMVVFLK